MNYSWLLLVAIFLSLGCANSRDAHERLHAVLWMQTSAEYLALAQQQYRAAQLALDKALDDHDTTWSAALEQVEPFANLPPAVIMDLDETVLDNTPLEASFILARIPFDRDKFKSWTTRAEAPAIPGALEFIKHAQDRGVTVFFVTNRHADEEADTRRNLEKLSIALPSDPDTILTSGENGWPSDKQDRRRSVSQRYRILLLIGDDLADFVSFEQNEPSRRRELAQQYTAKWGKEWFLIPNPIYGSWELALYPKGLQDADILARKRGFLMDMDEFLNELVRPKAD